MSAHRTRLWPFLAVLTLMAIPVQGSAQQVLDRSGMDIPEQLPSGAVLPQNLNDLGSLMADRFGEMIKEETASVPDSSGQETPLDLFTEGADEDPNLTEIRRIARDLETQQSLMVKLSGLQADLIDFAGQDPNAAYRSRIPREVCAMAISAEVCQNLTASFR